MPRSTLTWKKNIWKFNCSTSRPFQKGSVYKVLPIFEVCIFISKTELWKNTAPARRSCLLAHVEPFFHFQNSVGDCKMILSRAWLHDTVSCAAWNDARKGVYLKPLFKTPCSNCYWGWSIPIMLDYRDISLMESVPLMWGPVTASPMGARDRVTRGNWTHDHFRGGGPPPYNWYPIHNGENSMNCTGWPPNTP